MVMISASDSVQNGGRINVESVFGRLKFTTSLTSRTEILRQCTLARDKHKSPALSTLVGRCGLVHDVFAPVVLQQVCTSPSFLGDAQIQPPQEVGMRARGVERNVNASRENDVSAVNGCSAASIRVSLVNVGLAFPSEKMYSCRARS